MKGLSELTCLMISATGGETLHHRFCFLVWLLRNTVLNNRHNCEIRSTNTNSINTSQVWTSARVYICVRIHRAEKLTQSVSLNAHSARSLARRRKSRTLLFSSVRRLLCKFSAQQARLCVRCINIHALLIHKAYYITAQSLGVRTQWIVCVCKFVYMKSALQTSGCWHHVTALEQIGRACWALFDARSSDILFFYFTATRFHY